MKKLISLVLGCAVLVPVLAFADSTVTAVADSGSVITPSGVVVITTGDTQEFDISALGGYRVFGVTVDGSNVGNASSVTFSGIAFDPFSHTINVFSSPTGGSSPWCSGPLAPGYNVSLPGGGCGGSTNYVPQGQVLPDGSLCVFVGGCMVPRE